MADKKATLVFFAYDDDSLEYAVGDHAAEIMKWFDAAESMLCNQCRGYTGRKMVEVPAQDIEKGIEDEVQFGPQIMLMLDKLGIPTTEPDSDKHSRFLTTRLRIEKLITMYAEKDALIAKLEKDREISWTDR
jgi:hypothetical protein